MRAPSPARPLAFAAAALLPLLAAGCGPRAPGDPGARPPGTARPADPMAHRLYDRAGEVVTLPQALAPLAEADLVAIGELHFHPVGSAVELDVLKGLAAGDRPVALAMEFFEADHQPALDAYLAGELDEAAFREATGRDERYAASHRPLVEFCKARGIPVVAANAPRRLVKGFRLSKAASYPAYLATLPPADRALLPREFEAPEDAFKRRFMAFMGPKRGPAFYPSMALWNEAMAERIADFRATHPQHRVILVVGGFHVAAHLGLVSSYRRRRGADRVAVLLMADDSLEFTKEDRGEADVLLKVRPQEPGGRAAGR